VEGPVVLRGVDEQDEQAAEDADGRDLWKSKGIVSAFGVDLV
jgi:hypothetical protein